MGLDSYLKNLAAAVMGQSGQSAAPQSQPAQLQNLANAGFPGAQQMTSAQPPAAPAASSGFSPSSLVLPAVSAYLSAIGSPRRAGLGGALSRGGLAGIGTYEQEQAVETAKAQQAQEMALKQGQFGLQQQQFQAGEQKTAQARQDAMMVNQANAQQLATMAAQETDLKRKTILRGMSNSIKGLATPTKLDDLTKAAYSANDLDEALTRAQIGQAQASTAASGATTKEKQLEEQTLESMSPEERKQYMMGAAGKPRQELKTIYGPDGATKEILAGEGYAPPAGWTLDKPGKAGTKGPDQLLNLSRLHTLYTSTYGWPSRTVGTAPSEEAFAVTKGIDPVSGNKLSPLPAGSKYTFDPSIGHAVAVDKDGNVTHVVDFDVGP